MDQTVAPFLMFEGAAEEAVAFYVSVIPGSRIVELRRHGPEGPGPNGTVMLGRALLGGMEVLFSDSYVKHAFTFTPSLSLFVTCRSEAEIERVAASLGDAGKVLMPLGEYGFSRKFAWVSDRFGVSWQINLP
ncbi:VOC family protein [Enterovirga aerilata]|uniref:VOC family protein n=1 Tax=Enterovirga aerilata TaxID=2730920 RepID=A0A849I739_9HYPH|nr:VOC family protein [Enterovirga sp. DB1703]